MIISVRVQAQKKGYAISMNSGISSLGSYDDGLFVYYQGQPGFLGLNYLPKPGLSFGGYKNIYHNPKNTIDLGINSYFSAITLQYQVVSSWFESFKSSSKMYFGYIGPSSNVNRKLGASNWNVDFGLDILFRVRSGLESPQFDSLHYLQLSSLSGKPYIPGIIIMPKFGFSYSLKDFDLYLHWNQGINKFIQVNSFPEKRIMYLNFGANIRL